MTPDLQTLALSLAALIAGFAAGWAHFASLARVAEMLLQGRIGAIGLQLARLAALGVFLFLCTKGGTWPLLAGLAGIMSARFFVLRRAR